MAEAWWLPSPGVMLMGMFFIMPCIQLYHSFHSPRCPDNSSKCLRPLFVEKEPVDLYIYLSTDEHLPWWTAAGMIELRKAPFWNVTNHSFGEEMPPISSVSLPLSGEVLNSVRRNESALYAHCFLAKAGRALEPSSNAQQAQRHLRNGMLNNHVVHSVAPVTKLLPLRRQRYRNLLGNTSEAPDDDSPGALIRSAREAPVMVSLPGLPQLPVYPEEALSWAGAFLTVTAFMSPSLYTVVPRHVIFTAVVPWLLYLRQEKQASVQQAQEAERQQEAQWASEDLSAPITTHILPVFIFAIVVDQESYFGKVPPLQYKEITVQDGQTMETDVRYTVVRRGSKENQELFYVPPVSIDHGAFRSRLWRPLSSNQSVGVQVDVRGPLHYSVVQTMRQSMKLFLQFGFSDQDFEDVMDMFFRYPVHILALMQVIGMIQTVLTTLAFKNDIAFFKGRSDYTGLSSRSMGTDTIHEIVIFLYLYDFGDASRILLFQWGIGALISIWKFSRVARLRVYWSHFLPWISYNRGSASEQATEEIDAKGMVYLKCLLYPLSGCWGLYNLYHYHYKSWWSWLVSSMADFAYTFGFINMLPQVFVNYKLKTVAHMPWRVLMYKFFHTFIDDVFAFFIMSDYMTTKHRWMTLRDDIVFFVFLYQRYIYVVDVNRPDEFGFVYTDTGVEVNSSAPSAALLSEAVPQETLKVQAVADAVDVAGTVCVAGDCTSSAATSAPEIPVEVGAEATPHHGSDSVAVVRDSSVQ